ncbi:hypothetical protein O3P69_003669 [Scylla paramamosain]|uniref:Uncharacterized protein n=2 Tax=Scylla paramamosain TaxID=85552 RepID=A0AAW0UIZ8_SCYPA
MDSPPCNAETQEDILAKIDSRKSNKPLMEKKRRQRINRCLNDLKSLVLEGMKKDPSRYSKLEKADILEMTVRHVQTLHRHEGVGCRLGGGGRLLGNGRSVGGDGRTKYRAGFIHCAVEVTRYLAGLSGVPHDLHHRLISHLNTVTASLTCVPGMGQLPGASVAVGGGVVTVAPPASRPDPSSVATAADASSSVPHTPGSPFSVPSKSSPPALLSGSAVAPTLSTTVTTSISTSTSVALVPTRSEPQQIVQVLPSSSSSLPTPSQATQPRTLTLPALPTTAKTHCSPDAGLHNSENASVPQTSQLPKDITLAVPGYETNLSQTGSSFISSGTFPPRILQLTSTALTSSCENVTSYTVTSPADQNAGSVISTQGAITAKQGHPATPVDASPLSAPAQLSSESQDKETSPSWSTPLGFQVSVSLSSAASPPVFSSSLWSSPLLVRPTPTLPMAVQLPSSASPLLSPSSHSSSPSSSSSSSSSSPGTSVVPSRVLPQYSASAPSSSKEPLNLAMNHPQECTPRAHLKALSAFPCSRPTPYPLPRRLSPRPSQPWRPW